MPSTVLWKAVKPTKLREDAFRLEFLTALHSIENKVLKDFQKTTATWEHKVVFEKIISLVGGPQLLVGTDDKIYRYVNDGTPPHYIGPKLAGGMLVFKTGYKAKTTVGVIGSVAGGKFGTYTRRKEIPEHPGNEARKFDATIYQIWKPKFMDLMHKAMKKAAIKSGHYVGKES
jgi:hypothetical protein